MGVTALIAEDEPLLAANLKAELMKLWPELHIVAMCRRRPDSGPLRVIQASAGSTITMIPIDDVYYFEAADKYVRVVTANHEHLIRMSLRKLLQQLDSQRFWQIHRGTIVRCDAIGTAERDDTGKLTLRLRDNLARLVVSRLYADLFKGMEKAGTA